VASLIRTGEAQRSFDGKTQPDAASSYFGPRKNRECCGPLRVTSVINVKWHLVASSSDSGGHCRHRDSSLSGRKRAFVPKRDEGSGPFPTENGNFSWGRPAISNRSTIARRMPLRHLFSGCVKNSKQSYDWSGARKPAAQSLDVRRNKIGERPDVRRMLEVLAQDQPGLGIEFRDRRQAALEVGFHVTEKARQHPDAQSKFQCRDKICEAVATDRDDGVGRHARKP
jgi:hypothetical protein